MKKMSGLLVLMSIMALTFIGCSDDDTTNTEKPLDRAEKLAGTFKGDAVYKGASTVSTKVDVKVTGVNELEITVKGYQFNATTISDLVISKVNVLEQDEKNVLLEGVSIATVGGKSANVALTGSALVGGENIKLNVSVDGYNSMEYSGSRYTNGTGTELMSPVVSGICVISSKYDAATGIITYTVPADARVEDLAACEATFTISDGAIWVLKTKANAEEHKLMLKDAETSIEVTAENGDKKTYVFKREAVNTEDATISLINTYVGKLIVTVGGSANPAIENQKVFVTRTSSNRVKLVVKDFMFGGANIGDIIIDNVALYKGTDEIVLSGADKVKIKLGAEATEVLAGVSGVYSISKNGITLKIDIAVNESLSVHVDYAGSIFTDPISTQPLYVSVSHPNIINQKFEADGNITFSVNAKYADADFANLKVIIKLPEGATYKPTSADKFDFTQTTQWYTVTSADGKITKNYSITRNPLTFVNQKTYDFTNWTVGTVDPPSTAYTTPDGWQTPNAAVALIKALSVGEFYPYDGEYPVFPIDEGKVGKAAKIITLDTKGGLVGGFINAPKITAG
ncbi:MAG: calycin-like domain-containing protein, partial [Rikenellaceae bacterium]